MFWILDLIPDRLSYCLRKSLLMFGFLKAGSPSMKVTLQTHLKTGIGRINCIRPKHTNSRMYFKRVTFLRNQGQEYRSQHKHKVKPCAFQIAQAVRYNYGLRYPIGGPVGSNFAWLMSDSACCIKGLQTRIIMR